MPWPKNSSDLKWFKKNTLNAVVIMGRATWEDPFMPSPLINRLNILVTNQNKKSIEQPKVASQMDNSGVKSDLITADKDAPTTTNATDTKAEADDKLLKNKRKGRKRTVLTSVSGVEGYPTLSRRTLLGG